MKVFEHICKTSLMFNKFIYSIFRFKWYMVDYYDWL